jgi:hypothetical protein
MTTAFAAGAAIGFGVGVLLSGLVVTAALAVGAVLAWRYAKAIESTGIDIKIAAPVEAKPSA